MEAERYRCEIIREGVLPVLVDNTWEAHRLSARLYGRYGLVSLIVGIPLLRDLFDLSSRTLRTPPTDCDRLRIEQWLDLATKSKDKLLLLVPCSDRARDEVKCFAHVLESHFIILEPTSVLSFFSPSTDLDERYPERL